MNREQWLHHLTDTFRPRFKKAGLTLPKHLQISVGFPSKLALSAHKRRIGECWQLTTGHIFISPVHDSAHEAASTLLHELVHAALPRGTGHKAPFVRACTALGLTDGKPTSLGAGPDLMAELKRIAKKTPFKHRPLSAVSMPKAQATRLLKAACPECDYTVRVTRTWLEMGAPICPLDNVSMEEC